MAESSPVRAFIAIKLPEAVRRELEGLQVRLAVEPEKGIKWVSPQGIHLTLKFLGWVAPKRIDDIKSAVAEAVRPFEPFELGLSGLGGFPNLRRLNVVWCGLSGDLDRLLELQRSVEAKVAPLGFPTEKRAFSPHLTLARMREDVAPDAREKLSKKLAEMQYRPGLSIPVDAVSLMQSHLLPSGAIYTEAGRFPLAAT